MRTLLLFSICLLFIQAVQINKGVTVELQPYEGLSEVYVQEVYKNLIKVYPHVVINKPITLPKSAFINGRYRSDTLLKYLRRTVTSGNKIIGLTDKDITCPHNNSKDWGVFGYGDMPGTACVASPYRLNKSNKAVQLSKTAIHELGHNFGLDHCPTANCIMSDAKGKNNIDNENGFCTKCTAYLIKRQWKL